MLQYFLFEKEKGVGVNRPTTQYIIPKFIQTLSSTMALKRMRKRIAEIILKCSILFHSLVFNKNKKNFSIDKEKGGETFL